MSTSQKLRVIPDEFVADQGRNGDQCQTDNSADLVSIARLSLGATDDELATLLDVTKEQISAWTLQPGSIPYLAKFSLVLACSCVSILSCGKDDIFSMSDMARR